MSIQEIITLIVEKGLDTIMTAYEFEIDVKDIEQTQKDIKDFLRFKDKREEDFIISSKIELFKTPVIILKEKMNLNLMVL